MANAKEMFKLCFDEWLKSGYGRDINRSIVIENTIYEKLIKPYESLECWKLWQEITKEHRQKITEDYVIDNPTRVKEAIESKNFILVYPSFSGQAHESQLARNIQYLRDKGYKVEFDVAFLTVENEIHELKSIKDGAKLFKISEENIYLLTSATDHNLEHGLARLDELTIKNGYKAVIYPSFAFVAFWGSMICRHPNQKFYQMKYRPEPVGRLKSWAKGAGRYYPEKREHNEFMELEILDPSYKYADVTPKIKAIKNITFGSISRIQKLKSNEYETFIISALDQNPGIVYLYTAKESEKRKLPSNLYNHNRVYNLGWVNPVKAIKQFDIYVEPFPWGGGEMTMLALTEGLPYLILDTKEQREVGILNAVEQLAKYNQEVLHYSICKDIETLNIRLEELIKNTELRKKLGDTWAEAIRSHKPTTLAAWLDFFEIEEFI